MTVREARSALFGPEDKKTIEVHYDGESFDITQPSPAQEAFDKFIVDYITAPQPFHYCIALKQKYLVEGETA